MNSADSATLLRFIRQGRSFSGREPHCAFLNTGSTRFADISASSHLDLPDDGRAVGPVDWDGDGDLDLWIVNRNAPQVRFMRNHLPAGKHFISLRLKGTACNRDAIGARVELYRDPSERPASIRTLRAGDGYLSQSSKTLNFGLGDDSRPVRARVRWPDGTQSDIRDLAVDQTYTVVQGHDQAETWHSPAASRPADSVLAEHEPPPSPARPSQPIHVLSLSNAIVPRLNYTTYEGAPQAVYPAPRPSRVVLLNLWASWCQPCLMELEELTSQHKRLSDAGIDVVALSVDGVGEADGSAESDRSDESQSILQRLEFPFRHGRADARLLDVLQLLNNHLFDLHLPLPVPCSWLIDEQGKLIAMYKGPVAPEQILQDAALRRQDLPARRDLSAPFPGKWHEPLNQQSMLPLVDSYVSAGHLAEADDVIRRLESVPKDQLLPAIVRLGVAYYKTGNSAKAFEHFQVAVKIDPKFVGVENELGLIREAEGRPDAAAKLYREALRRNPQSVSALNNLAWLLATHPHEAIHNSAEAVTFATRAVELTQSSDPRVLDTLAAAYAAAGDFDRAAEVAQSAIDLSHARSRLALAAEIQKRLLRYQAREAYRRPE